MKLLGLGSSTVTHVTDGDQGESQTEGISVVKTKRRIGRKIFKTKVENEIRGFTELIEEENNRRSVIG